MKGTDQQFTQRAKAWVKESEPDAEQIHAAYVSMTQKLKRQPDLKGDDSDACLEFLIEAYQEAGGNVDDLFALCAEGKPTDERSEYKIDSSPLYETSAAVTPSLSPSEKRMEFLKLKERLCGKPATAA